FCIRATPYTGGLGAFATKAIPAGTEVFRAQEPFVKVVYGPYKKEVCAYCFSYDRGRKMKQVERSVGGKEQRGIAWFCSETCRTSWKASLKAQDLETLSRVSAGVSKVQKGRITGNKILSPADIEAAWQAAERAPVPKSLALLHEEDDQDTVYFLLDGILARARNPSGWNAFLSLNPSLQPYDTPGTLESHLRIFHYLRFTLPEALRPFCSPETILALVTRDHGNSFGIFEDELGRDGEMLGYGTWTEASFFNHSCGANLTKRRSGRFYVFTAKCDIQPGEELCINYIEDAVAEPVDVRRARLQAGWGFVCRCARCTEE
ncbi:SET domain-containing protein, partial [Cystobasidium minutum MCA 4210]|uniref:SET domain-containing protein n=1 Tax=Cystobasidium minutum MCA 4210 TaxID=1397322 RepID=UPI0034CF34B1